MAQVGSRPRMPSHHTVTPANTADTAAHPTETQVATSTLAPMHSSSLKEAVMTHTTATTTTTGKGGDGMSDRMMRRVLKVCAFVLFLSGIAMILTGIVQRDWRMGLYGVLSLLFALSDVLQLFLVGGCWAAPSGHDVRFEDAAGRWVYEGSSGPTPSDTASFQTARIIRSGMRFCESRASMATSKPFNRS